MTKDINEMELINQKDIDLPQNLHIPFNVPLVTGKEMEYVKQVLGSSNLAGHGQYNQQCQAWFKNNLRCIGAFLTSSATSAMEMAAILLEIKAGDEIIMPSFAFVSAATAFMLLGAKIVFVDIRPDTMNIDEQSVEKAITDKTKAILLVHYGGISCDMERICRIADKYHLKIIEDAAHGVMAKYKDQFLGTIGDIGIYSFHETKNYTCGEGGAIIINRPELLERAIVVRDKGTNRCNFLLGKVDKYTWVDLGSSYQLSEINAAVLFAQLQSAEEVCRDRRQSWELYYFLLQKLAQKGCLNLPVVPEYAYHNGHIFYIKTESQSIRDQLINYLKEYNIQSSFHFIPLHSSPFGIKNTRFCGNDIHTTSESRRLLRLPMWYKISSDHIRHIARLLYRFYDQPFNF
jgi:dTDP-4-amino-4,6-dideoxygalactose transaminase